MQENKKYLLVRNIRYIFMEKTISEWTNKKNLARKSTTDMEIEISSIH